MLLLQSGTDTAVIALWLGHASPTTTHVYLEADLAMKERALARVAPRKTRSMRFRPSDRPAHAARLGRDLRRLRGRLNSPLEQDALHLVKRNQTVGHLWSTGRSWRGGGGK
jgi:hypothetical protein